MKIAYDGTVFHGQARQPGLRTVEGEVIHALVRAPAIRDVRTARFESASRTDRGVSALGNVVAFDTGLPPRAAVRAFNAKSRGVWAWAAAAVPEDFRARRARERWYRYLLPGEHELRVLNRAVGVFQGEHDFRNFTRDRERTVARIDTARASIDGNFVAIDLKAPSFRWNLVRRLVSAALRVEAGDATVGDLTIALDGPGRIDMGLAPAEPLILMDVRYNLEFSPVSDPTTASRLREIVQNMTRRTRLLEEISERFSARSP
ncbi:MAG: tRNA pseudouridine(38-40) synthase TruA [Methanobacteriota archaeon]|nr:MAG: tRNA pseudouridine(38-40) synthase TruA [Euryarchaeota archaeon]